jgi:DNA-binding transcriptional ArsR family regulator
MDPVKWKSQMKAEDQLSVVFAALADPTRRAILARLADGDATVTELAEPFSISLPAISRHLKVLERAGLISRSRSGQWRSSSLDATPLKEATAWMERYRVFWDASFDRLDEHLRRIQRDTSLVSFHRTEGVRRTDGARRKEEE